MESMQMFNYGYGIIVAVAALFFNFRIQKSQMKLTVVESIKPIEDDVKEIKTTLDEHGKIIKENSEFTKTGTMNKNFYIHVDTAVKSALEKLAQDVADGKINDSAKPAQYIIWMGSAISNLYREIMVDGIAKEKKDVVASRIEIKMTDGRKCLASLLDPEFQKDYYNEYQDERDSYYREICEIISDVDNNKDDRFRISTISFIQRQTKNFARYYTKWMQSKQYDK